jgi:hypothetical protein
MKGTGPMRKRFYGSRRERDRDWRDEIEAGIGARKAFFKAIYGDLDRRGRERKARGERLLHLSEPEPEWL